MNYESQYYGIVNTGPELTHFGIKGQKWGVRRFQYEDGSYTQAGLERYRKAKSDASQAKAELKDAKRAYKYGQGTNADVFKAKSKVASAKIDLKKADHQLKEDVDRDKGRELYRRGKTIEINSKKREMSRKVGGAAIAGSAYAFYKYGQPFVNSLMYRRNLKGTPVSSIAAASVLAGSVAASAVLEGKYAYEDKKMRTYWHNRGKQG